MNWGIARSLFAIVTLAICGTAAYALSEPASRVIHASDSADACLMPIARATPRETPQPDSDLLLFLVGLSQGMYRS